MTAMCPKRSWCPMAFIEHGSVPVASIPVKRVTKWATDPYKDAREIKGDSTPRRKRTAAAKFRLLGYCKRFELVGMVDDLHIEVRCKSCGYVFTREISCLKTAKSDKCKGSNNIECCNCGIHADGTYGHRHSENKRSMDESVVVEYYEKGISATQTAKHFGMNLRRVRRIIDEAGVARDRQMVLDLDDYPTELTGDPFLDEELVCAECGRTFTRHQYAIATNRKNRVLGKPRFCSRKCSQRQNSRTTRHNRRINERLANADVEPDSIALGDLIERDGGICQICKKPVDLDDGFFDQGGHFHAGRNYPSVDHIKPVSKGGANTWDNVQLAHIACNSGRCNRDDGEEVA